MQKIFLEVTLFLLKWAVKRVDLEGKAVVGGVVYPARLSFFPKERALIIKTVRTEQDVVFFVYYD